MPFVLPGVYARRVARGMRDFGESHALLFITTALSHAAMVPAMYFLYHRRYLFELCVMVFALGTSFMYHTCESLAVTILLTEKQWHRMDNMGVIAMMGVYYTFLACFPVPAVEMVCKCSVLFIAIISQQPHPWDIRFTIAPILLFGLQPVVQHCLINRRPPKLHRRYVALSFLSVLLAIPFFVLGLDDPNDPYRVFHGMWHLFGGVAILYAWRAVAQPTTPAIGASVHAGGKPAQQPLSSEKYTYSEV